MKALLAAIVAVLLCVPALPYTLVQQGGRVAVAKSALTVVPSTDWNRQTKRPGRMAESWTLDGLSLNDVTFYAGIASGETLFREVDRKNRPLPRFAKTMLAPDIVQLFETSYRIAGGSSLFTVSEILPATFAGQQGFRFRYTFTLEAEEVRRDGEATATVWQDKLYLVTYEAPEIHYFARDLPAYRSLIASARLPGPKVTVE